MVIFIIHDLDIPACEPECDAPVATDFDGPGAGPNASQWVEVQPWQPHVSRLHGHIQAAQDQAEPIRVLGLDTGGGAGLEEPAQTLVPEALDRHCTSVTQRVTGVNCDGGTAGSGAITTADISNQLTSCEADVGFRSTRRFAPGFAHTPRSLH